MMLHFSPEFRRDLRELKARLKQQGFKSADTVGKDILSACSDLKTFPGKGLSAADRFEMDTDMKCLILGKNIVFYRINKDMVEVVRLFDTRTNILFRMFGIDDSNPDSEEYWEE